MLSNFRDIADVGMLWLGCGVGLVWLATIALKRSQGLSLNDLRGSELGGTYSISLLMVLPIFVTLLALFVECNQLMLVKLGCCYASYSAARSAAVWQPIDQKSAPHPNGLEDRCRFAAAKALTPFAFGTKRNRSSDPLQIKHANLLAETSQWQTGYSRWNLEYLAQKFLNAYAATTADVTSITQGTQECRVKVEVWYQAPFIVPGIGRLFAVLGAAQEGDEVGQYVREISSTTEMSIDFPLVNSPQPRVYALGVRYGEPLKQNKSSLAP